MAFSLNDVFGNKERDRLLREKQVREQRIYAMMQQPYTPPPYVRPHGVVDKDILKNNGIFTAPLSAVRQMWQIKHPEWFLPADYKMSEDESFMFQRLLQAGAFEVFSYDDANPYLSNSLGRISDMNALKAYRLKEE